MNYDILFEISQRSSFLTIVNLMSINKSMYSMINDEYFWKTKIKLREAEVEEIKFMKTKFSLCTSYYLLSKYPEISILSYVKSII